MDDWLHKLIFVYTVYITQSSRTKTLFNMSVHVRDVNEVRGAYPYTRRQTHSYTCDCKESKAQKIRSNDNDKN